ncbi:HNH endonuclease signature motif containing protein [Paenibacillus sp. PDC88]|uniref:HNH endonuclease signature motif containing protein n=1 Tax=Paenibacillus sp. PDC88 TaxID=1884375 RepID=UPI00089A1122|nr:HNH endonuclease [Paenibacillus sp. PDC88]
MRCRACRECGDEFQLFSNRRDRRYLCASCRRAALGAGKLPGSQNPNWKGGVKLSTQGYVLVKDPASTRSDGYTLGHRLVMERFLGRKLLSYEDVHHIDGNKNNNRIENLKVLVRTEHMRHHALLNTEKRRRDCLGRYA